MATRLTREEIAGLAEAFERSYKYYKGWAFGYEYPGAFAYHQLGGELSVYFTPDYDEPGEVSVQVLRGDGEFMGGAGVPYPGGLEAHELFSIVRPWLDRHGSW